MPLYHVGAWLLALHIALGVTVIDFASLRFVAYAIYIYNGLLFPLYVNGKPPESSRERLKKLILSSLLLQVLH